LVAARGSAGTAGAGCRRRAAGLARALGAGRDLARSVQCRRDPVQPRHRPVPGRAGGLALADAAGGPAGLTTTPSFDAPTLFPSTLSAPSSSSPLSPAATQPMGPPLWQQLQQVAAVLAAVRAGSSATTALEAVDPALRPGVQALVFHALRWLGRGEGLRRHLAKRTPPPAADALLCGALALGWDAARSPYEPFTLVDQAVEAAKRNPATRAQASFINACLRRF